MSSGPKTTLDRWLITKRDLVTGWTSIVGMRVGLDTDPADLVSEEATKSGSPNSGLADNTTTDSIVHDDVCLDTLSGTATGGIDHDRSTSWTGTPIIDIEARVRCKVGAWNKVCRMRRDVSVADAKDKSISEVAYHSSDTTLFAGNEGTSPSSSRPSGDETSIVAAEPNEGTVSSANIEMEGMVH